MPEREGACLCQRLTERAILFSGLEVIILIPFQGELKLGSTKTQQIEFVNANDDGDQGDTENGHASIGAQQEAREVERHELLGEHEATEHGKAHGGQDVSCHAASVNHKVRNEIEQTLNGAETQIERTAQSMKYSRQPKRPMPHCAA